MKVISQIALLCTIALVLVACGGPGESVAEFDGGYVWTSGDKYVAVSEVTASTTQIARGGMSITALMNAQKYYYVLDPTPSATLSSSDVQGVYVKGDYTYKYFSLHKLEEKQLAETEGLFENKGPATKEKPFYYAGQKIEVAKKQDENGYFFKVKESLASGKYVAWIDKSFWIFAVK